MNRQYPIFVSPKSCPRITTACGNPCRIRLGVVGLQSGSSKQGKIGGIQPLFGQRGNARIHHSDAKSTTAEIRFSTRS